MALWLSLLPLSLLQLLLFVVVAIAVTVSSVAVAPLLLLSLSLLLMLLSSVEAIHALSSSILQRQSDAGLCRAIFVFVDLAGSYCCFVVFVVVGTILDYDG